MISRRVMVGGLVAAGAAGWPGFAGRVLAQGEDRLFNRLAIPALLEGKMADGVRVYDLHMRPGLSKFFPDVNTPTLGINQEFSGPVMKFRAGEKVRINVKNAIGGPSTLHWHGFHLPAKMDGGPHQVVADGASWSPEFMIKQHAASYWYHSHLMGKTGEQVWRGLAAMMIVEDDDSDRLKLPKTWGVDDIPLVLQDRAFQRDGSFAYRLSMHDKMMGMAGDFLLVNGTIGPFVEAVTEKLRLRVLNGSNSRFYNLGLSGNAPFYQIASDGSFLPEPFKMTRLALAPGERAEIIVDVEPGKTMALRHFFGRSNGASGQGGGRGFDIVQIRAKDKLAPSPALPETLVKAPRLDAALAVRTRRFVMESRMGPAMMMGGSPHTINAKTMDLGRIDEVVRLGDVEIWQIDNPSGMAHPFHVHDVQFHILDRNGQKPHAGEQGLKDTVVSYPGQSVRIVVQFNDYADADTPYMYHCHILEHEDAGMMGQFTVKA